MKDAFAVFGLEPSLELDLGAIEQRYRDLSRVLHPDRHVGKPALERRRALEEAISVNDAWRRLKDPVRRVEALCARHGIAYGEGVEPPAAPELLLQIMDSREQLAEARAARDKAALSALEARTNQRKLALLRELEATFAGGNLAEPAARRALQQSLGELRYYQRFLEEAALAADEMD